MNKPKIAGTSPKMENMVEGKIYAWCACGESTNQPWCNGSHKTTEMTPKIFKAEESKMAALCMCKQTKNAPYCDGSHMKLS